MTQCAAINLKKATVPNQTSPQPWQYHERTGHVLRPEDNPIQTEVIALAKYAEDHKMKINKNKTKVMVFNQAKSVDILPEVKLDENELEVVEETKFLGIILRNDLKWQSNTKNTLAKCYTRMWLLRNLQKYGATEAQMIEVYIQQIRSVAEMACPVWNSGLTLQEVTALERIQRTAMAVIRGENHTNYREALEHFKIKTLSDRREE